MRHGVTALLCATTLAVNGCGHESPTAAPAAPSPTATVARGYDATLEPAAAVLALVPDDVTTVMVTDFDQVRAELGVDGLTDTSPAADIATFWQRADEERPLLTAGMLRSADAELAQRYGITQLDVAWEAHLLGADGHGAGWVLRFRDGTDMGRVADAVQDPASPLAGGTVDAADDLVTSGTTSNPADSWAADPDAAGLATLPADSTYLSRGCLRDAGTDPDLAIDELGAWAVQFQGSLVTARLGPGRQDLFTRMRLGESSPAFAAAFETGVADPRTGRIGYEMTNPAAAAKLALAGQLPFAACS